MFDVFCSIHYPILGPILTPIWIESEVKKKHRGKQHLTLHPKNWPYAKIDFFIKRSFKQQKSTTLVISCDIYPDFTQTFGELPTLTDHGVATDRPTSPCRWFFRLIDCH